MPDVHAPQIGSRRDSAAGAVGKSLRESHEGHVASVTGDSAIERLDREALLIHQQRRLDELLQCVRGASMFYARKLEGTGSELASLPFTTKFELIADQQENPPWGTVGTEPVERYTRYSHTSGTTGTPLRWNDTPESWQWSLECWKAVYRGARVDARDRIFFAFSFGPFYGFWTAFDAAAQIGAHCVPAGGMTSPQRLALIAAVRPSVICCTPTYALRLAEVAQETGTRITNCGVRTLIVAGEPGGSIQSTRQRIEQAWAARVIDHHGLTEVGPISFECWEAPGFLHVNEAEFICEILDPRTQAPVRDGEPGELVVTNLGRSAQPVIRYRTGDIVVRDASPCLCGRTFARLAGGIRARVDDMVTVRGVNVYPAAIESIVRQFDAVNEFRATVTQTETLASLTVEIECQAAVPRQESVAERVAEALTQSLGLKVPVTLAAAGALPRFEMKAKRFVVERRD
jgi:phenylacetate-CoA ligase